MDAIQKNDFLRRLDDEQTAMMVELLVVYNFKPGEDVIKEGTEGDSMYIVAGGGVRHPFNKNIPRSIINPSK